MPTRILPLLFVMVAMMAASGSSIRAEEEAKWSSLKAIQPIEPESNDDELRKLQKLRFNEALAEVKARTRIYEEGLGAGAQSLEFLLQGHDRLTEAAIDLHSDPNEQIKIYEGRVAMAKLTEEKVRERTRVGEDKVVVHRASASRLSAEITLLKARRALEKAPKAGNTK